jgi:hypothetical protein
MEYARYLYAKITPTDQEFDQLATDPIIIRALRELSDQPFFILSEENGFRFYECVLYVKDGKVFPSTRTDQYKWGLENSIILQQALPATVGTRKLTEAQYIKKGSEYQIRNPIAHNLTLYEPIFD